MPQQIFYLLVIVAIVAVLLLARVIMARIRRRGKSQRIERGIAEYLSQKPGGKSTTKPVTFKTTTLRKSV